MDELIQQLTSKAGLSADQAKAAVGVVGGFLKDKLPADLMNQLTSAMPDLGGMLGNATGAVTGAAGAVGSAATGAVSGAAGRGRWCCRCRRWCRWRRGG